MSRPVGKLCGILLLAGSSLGLAQQYTLTTAAGGAPPTTPVTATNISIGQTSRVTVDSKGNTYFSSGNAVFKIDTSGNLTLVAGNSRPGYSGDGGPAIQAQLNGPQGLAVGPSGNLYIADSVNNRVRVVNTSGVINTFAGTGQSSPGGGGTFNDGGLAINGLLRLPSGVCVDSNGNVFIADTGDNIIREVTIDGIINTVAGDGFGSYSGDTNSALTAELHTPTDVAVDKNFNIYIADSANAAIREVTYTTGIITTIAGNASIGDTGDTGPATSASLVTPYAITVDSSGNVYFVENGDSVIRKVTPSNMYIYRVAGNGIAGFSGDGSAATKAQFNFPTGMALDSSGNIYVADSLNNRIRKITGATVSTIGGNGVLSYSGDGGPASSAQLNTPQAVAVDSSGNFYFADTVNNVVRKVTASGAISTIAGNGTQGFGGDGGAATAAQFNKPQGIAVDSSGKVYVADDGQNQCIGGEPAAPKHRPRRCRYSEDNVGSGSFLDRDSAGACFGCEAFCVGGSAAPNADVLNAGPSPPEGLDMRPCLNTGAENAQTGSFSCGQRIQCDSRDGGGAHFGNDTTVHNRQWLACGATEKLNDRHMGVEAQVGVPRVEGNGLHAHHIPVDHGHDGEPAVLESLGIARAENSASRLVD